MEERLLFENNYEKPDLTEEFLKHYGTLGMKWGIRNGPPYPIARAGKVIKNKLSKGSRYKAAKRTNNYNTSSYKDNETALKERDLEYINYHKNQFSTKEMNDLMNRIQTEERISTMYKSQKDATKNKVKNVLKSPAGKAVTGVAVTALGASAYKYAKYYQDYSNGIVTGPIPPVSQVFKDVPKAAKNIIDSTMKKKYGKYL